MFWMGRNRRGMGGGLFLFPGLLFGGFFGIYAILAVLNVAGAVIGAVFSGLTAAFSGVMNGIGSVFSGVGADIGNIGGLVIDTVLGLVLFYVIRNHRKAQNDAEE